MKQEDTCKNHEEQGSRKKQSIYGDPRRNREHRERDKAEQLKRSEYKKRMRELQRRAHEEQFRIKRSMFEELAKLRPDKKHYWHHTSEKSFDQYYTRLKIARPVSLVFIALLLLLLFLYGGFNTGLGIVVLVFSTLSALGYIAQSYFLSSIQKRVLKPIERLEKGMDKIARGEYEVEVEQEGAWEVQSLIRNFNVMAKKLRENDVLKAEYEENRKQLIASISHDLKTPITSILGYIEGIADVNDMPQEKQDKYLKIIHNNIVYMNKLIDDLFLFSKLDMQKLTFEFINTPMSPFISDIMEELRLELEEIGTTLIYRDETDGRTNAKIDSKRFYQVIRNIVDNALKYGDANGLKISARLYNNAKYVFISLANNGTAIPQDKLEHIFDRFYRLDSARTKDMGSTGLGLAISKELAEAHGGCISATSNDGEGTCFTVAVPLLKTEKTDGGVAGV